MTETGGNMATKLEWHGERLTLGGIEGWTLGAVRKEGKRWRAVLNRMAGAAPSYESITDAMQDLESEVRRLLKEVGVEVA